MKIEIVGAGKIGVIAAILLESSRFCKSVVLDDSHTGVDLTGLKNPKPPMQTVSKPRSLLCS